MLEQQPNLLCVKQYISLYIYTMNNNNNEQEHNSHTHTQRKTLPCTILNKEMCETILKLQIKKAYLM